MINAQEIQGNWNKIRGKVKEKWGQLSDDDLAITGGNVDQLVGRIQQKTGEGREAIEKFLSKLTASGSAGVAQAADTAREYAQQAGSAAREYAQQAGSALQGAGERIRDGYGQVADEARERYQVAEEVIRHNPAQSVAAAFGFGLVLGLFVGMAVRSR